MSGSRGKDGSTIHYTLKGFDKYYPALVGKNCYMYILHTTLQGIDKYNPNSLSLFLSLNLDQAPLYLQY